MRGSTCKVANAGPAKESLHAANAVSVRLLPLLPSCFPSLSPLPSLGAVEEAQVAVPADADNVNKEQSVLQRHKGKVDGLHGGPDVVVARQGGAVVFVELLLGVGPLKDGHGGEEDADHDGGEDALVAGDAGDGLDCWVAVDDVAGEEVEPCCGDGAEDDWGCQKCTLR